MSFRNRLTLSLVITIILVQIATIAFSYNVIHSDLVERGKAELSKSAIVFMRQLEAQSERFSEGVEILALDFPLRQAVAQGNIDTAASALRNHGNRVGAKRMMLVGLDGNVRTDTSKRPLTGERFPFPSLLDEASVDGQSAALTQLFSEPYWLVVVPVNAPMPIGYIVAGVPVDSALIDHVSKLSSLPTKIVLGTLNNNGSVHFVSNVNVPRSLQHNASVAAADFGVVQVDNTAGRERLWVMTKLQTAKDSAPVVAQLNYPLVEALKPIHSLGWPLVGIVLIALALSVAVFFWIANTVSKPIEYLATQARRIAQGDYTPLEPQEGSGEIQQLASALSHMADAVRDREVHLHSALARVESARDEAVRANGVKSEFLAMMSHEIRTPLNGVIGMADALARTDLNEEQSKFASIIHDSGTHLLGLLNDILDFSKLEADGVEFESQPVSMEALLKSAADIVGPRAQAKGVQVFWKKCPDMPAYVRGDENRLRQVILNLAGNAAKFTEKGQIEIRAEVQQSLHGSSSYKISVKDSGIGISEDQLGKLFVEFSQADASISRKFGGTGLGLAISKKLVEGMGGSIKVCSSQGQGSTFWFELPLVIPSASEIESVRQDSQRQKMQVALNFLAARKTPARVLVVEDNLTNQVVISAALKNLNVQIEIAQNGLEALTAVAKQDYDVVLMDLHMPEMGGLEATREIRKLPAPKGHTPIIALTANSLRVDRENCHNAGMNAYIAKPFKRDDLIMELASAMQGTAKIFVDDLPERRFEMSEVAVFDETALQKFREDSGEELLQILLSSYLSDTSSKLKALAQALSTHHDHEEVVRITHSLKSASALAGAAALSKLAAELEGSLRQGTVPPSEKFQRMNALFTEYSDQLAEKGYLTA